MSISSLRSKERSRIFLIGLILLLTITFLTVNFTRAAVALLYFRGYSQVDGILLTWETEVEPDIQGFYIMRSDIENGNYERVSQFIPGLGSDTTGDYYTYIDSNVVGGVAYWYQLEMVDVNNLVTFSEKIRVFAGIYSSTPTVTATALLKSATPTFSQLALTATQGVSATSQVTPSPVETSTSIQETTSGFTEVVTATAVVSATATLIPLPEITLQFPTAGANPESANAGTNTISESTSAERDQQLLVRLGRATILVLIVLVWAVLAGWFYISARRME